MTTSKKPGKSHKRAVPLGTETVSELVAMEKVASQGERSDRTHQERFYRSWLKSDADGYRKHLFKLRREGYVAGQAGVTEQSGVPISVAGEGESLGVLGADLGEEFKLVLEYRKHRVEFLEWLAGRGGVSPAGTLVGSEGGSSAGTVV